MEKHPHINTDQLSFGFGISQNVTDDYALHCHNFFEVYYFLEGDVDYLVEGQYYKPTANSVLLLSPHAFHGVKIRSTIPYKRYSMHFSPDIILPERRSLLLRAFPKPGQSNRSIYFEHADEFQLLTYLEALESCARKPQSLREQLVPICVEALLARIADMSDSISSFSEETLKAQSEDTITSILFYLNKHLQENVTLDQLCEKFFISKHHLNKVFRKATGTTVIDYLLRKRIAYAQMLLLTGWHAKEAAASSGFGDYSSFYRSYIKVTGHAPGEDRRALPIVDGEHIEYISMQS